MRRPTIAATALPLLLVLAPTVPASAAPVSGAIFTSDVTGAPVNLNHYDDKRDVYLNGGPGINAPDDAAGLPAGTYSYQVTNPNGEVLLSEDDVACRQFSVDDSGVIQAVVTGVTCTTGAHASGADLEDDGITVQLFPYADTPNPGGVYKVWVSLTSDLDCGAPGSKNCFVPRYSKTDNFKVQANAIVEIDTRFWAPGDNQPLLGMAAGWVDTNGAANVKYSEYAPELLAFREAHVEAVEQGLHTITLSHQTGCTIDRVKGQHGKVYRSASGDYQIPVRVARWQAGDDTTYRVEVYCK